MVHYGGDFEDSTLYYFTRNYSEMLTGNYSEPEQEALKAYNIEHWKDLILKKKNSK